MKRMCLVVHMLVGRSVGRLVGWLVRPLVGGFGPLENHIRYVTKPSQSTD